VPGRFLRRDGAPQVRGRGAPTDKDRIGHGMNAPHPGMRALLVELNDLKRITSAAHQGSIATRLFFDAWTAILDGHPAAEVGLEITARALAAARLGDIDQAVLTDAGLSRGEADGVLQRAITAIGGPLDPALAQSLKEALSAGHRLIAAELPPFVGRLARQPRAGITCPGRPRILLEPPENHADHCLMVAAYGVLLAPDYRAEPGVIFLAALAHHLHNAALPDSGFTGEMLVEPHLNAVVARFTRAALDELPPAIRAQVEAARAILPGTDTAEGEAFHAADALDRVLQVDQYRRAGALSMTQVLGEMELVHAGPVKTHQDAVVRQFGFL
jgi:5'-deoxynucleotidase YfbR-like HD superfamily hydrolase